MTAKSLGTRFLSSLAALGALQLSSLIPSAAQAAVTEVKDWTIYQPYLSVRALGMGGAFTAVADDYNAVFYNPAGLARLSTWQINMGFGASVDTKAWELKENLDYVSNEGNGTDMVNLLEKNYGNHYSLRMPTINAFWVWKGWGFAANVTDVNLEMSIHQQASPSLNLIATQDMQLAMARGWDVHWSRDKISLGVTGKAIYRAYYNRAFQSSELMLDSELLRPEDAKEGLAIDADLGILWTPELSSSNWLRYTRPTIGATVRNVVDAGFTSNMHLLNEQSGEPPRLGRRFDLGTLWELPDWWVFRSRGMIDMRDMGHENWSAQKGFHAGAEFLWKMRSWWQGGWRIGVNQGYFTAGFTGKVAFFNLDVATYAEEVGPTDSPKANRRYVAKASLDF